MRKGTTQSRRKNRVTVKLTDDDFAYYDFDVGSFLISKGEYEIIVASDAARTNLAQTIIL